MTVAENERAVVITGTLMRDMPSAAPVRAAKHRVLIAAKAWRKVSPCSKDIVEEKVEDRLHEGVWRDCRNVMLTWLNAISYIALQGLLVVGRRGRCRTLRALDPITYLSASVGDPYLACQ